MANWIRVLKVIFTEHLGNNKGREIVFGDNFPKPDLNIECDVYKYASSLKDYATIKITNMTYNEVIKMTANKLFDVKIICGYREQEEITIFDGAVARINNSFESDRSNTMIIFCTSKFIARYCQSQLNFTLNSGINVYSAIKFMCSRAGMKEEDMMISPQLQKQVLSQSISNSNQNIASFLSAVCKNNSSYIVETDAANGACFSIFDAAKSNYRVIRIKDSQLLSYPTLSSDGLDLTTFASFNFKCGDTIQVNNALINLEETTNLSSLSKQSGMYIDTSAKIDSQGDSYGSYMVLECIYKLQNRGPNFSCRLKAKARSLISNYVGGVK